MNYPADPCTNGVNNYLEKYGQKTEQVWKFYQNFAVK